MGKLPERKFFAELLWEQSIYFQFSSASEDEDDEAEYQYWPVLEQNITDTRGVLDDLHLWPQFRNLSQVGASVPFFFLARDIVADPRGVSSTLQLSRTP